MAEIELSAGVLEYGDSGGEGPVDGLHARAGLDGRHWRGVDRRAGARVPLRVADAALWRPPAADAADADLSLRGHGPDRRRVPRARSTSATSTLCFNDWGGAQTMVADGLMERVGRLVLVSCETEGNYPPGFGGHAAWLSCKLPGGLAMMRRTLLRRGCGGCRSSTAR